MFSSFAFLLILATPPILSVHDGDTLTVKSAEGFEVKVRLIGIDCPEVPMAASNRGRRRKAMPGQPMGVEARERLKALVAKPFEIKTYGSDVYGRSLAELQLKEGRIVNEVLVEEGYCEFYKKAKARGFTADRYRTAESKARQAKKGIWSLKQYESPDLYRRRHRD